MKTTASTKPLFLVLSGLLAALPAPVFAADELSAGDTAWMLTSTLLVLMMTLPGLSLFYAGMVRAKNALSVMMQCFAIASLVTVLWVLYLYSLAFSDGGAMNQWIGGLSKAFMSGVGVDTVSGTIPETVFSMFQLTFAIITPALIVGAFAERMKFSAMLWFMGLWVTLVYAPVAHWVWGGGWLGDLGALDFAGGTVVHINAGVAALVAALVLGKRKGYPGTPMPPHNLMFTMIGAGMLWVGWFGFNAGSELAADGTAGMAMAVTQVATATAALAWMFAEWFSHGKPTTLGIASGAIAGLVARVNEQVATFLAKAGLPSADPNVVKALIYAADADNWQAMAALAKEHKAPLAVTAATLAFFTRWSKTDRRDALKLARFLRSGDLTSVYVPSEETEGRGPVLKKHNLCGGIAAEKNQTVP